MKILIADSSGPFRDALLAQLRMRHNVICCDSGNAALAQIRKQMPDIVLLDLGISGYDGLSVVQAVSFSVYKPRILVISSFLSEHIVTQLNRFGVDQILQKPITLCAAMAQINSLICECEKEDVHDHYSKIHQLLHLLGFRRCCSGYDCVLEAVYLVRYAGMRMMTKEVYPAVAKACGGTSSRVEKAIRDGIHDAWSRRDDALWSMYFPCNRDGSLSCPSNTDFILAFASDAARDCKKVNFL